MFELFALRGGGTQKHLSCTPHVLVLRDDRETIQTNMRVQRQGSRGGTLIILCPMNHQVKVSLPSILLAKRQPERIRGYEMRIFINSRDFRKQPLLFHKNGEDLM